MHLLLLLSCIILLNSLACCDAQANGSVVTVRDSEQLYEALTGKAQVIVLQNDVALGPEFDKFEATPLLIDRYEHQTPRMVSPCVSS